MNRNGKIPLPCVKDGVKCPLRRAGCQAECEEYKKFASAVAERNKAVREAKRKESETWLSTT